MDTELSWEEEMFRPNLGKSGNGADPIATIRSDDFGLLQHKENYSLKFPKETPRCILSQEIFIVGIL